MGALFVKQYRAWYIISMNPNIFRLYDIRGVYPDELNGEVVYRIARAFVQFLSKRNKKTTQTIVVGRDTRLSSQDFADAFVRGVMDEGGIVRDLGLSITPSVYSFVADNNFDGGVNITASHQPNPFNGLKLVSSGAAPIGGESGLIEIQRIAENISAASAKKSGGERKNISNVLEDYVRSQVQLGSYHRQGLDMRGISVAADAGNGTAGPFARKFFEMLGVNYEPLFFEPDGRFPNHVPDPLLPENVKDLVGLMGRKPFDLGVAFDGDGDRILFFTEEGRRIRGDEILALVARSALIKQKGQRILYDIRASRMVKEVIEKYGGVPVLPPLGAPVGHTLIKHIMRRENAQLAGELSGHYYLGSPYFYEVPFFILSEILKELSQSKMKMSELVTSLESKWYHSGEINFKIEDKSGKMEELASRFSDGDLSRLDGIRIDYPDWWFNARPSANDPVLRLIVEADSQEKLEEKLAALTALIGKG
jgi:phosphomannomutase